MNVEGWLRSHTLGSPAELVDTMLAAATATPADTLAGALAEGAMRLYGTVLKGEGGRADALPLLAADALLTHAFQAQAEEDPAGAESLSRQIGGMGRLQAISQSLATP